METDYWDVTNVLEEAVEKYEPIRKSLVPFVTAEELSPQSRQDVLEILSQHLLDPELTEFISESFSPLLLELVQRAVKRVSKETHGHRYEQDRLFVATGKHLLTNSYGVESPNDYVDGKERMPKYDTKKVCLPMYGTTQECMPMYGPTQRKKSQKPKRATSDEDIVKAALKLVQHDRNMMSAMVDWENFANFLSHDSKMVKWYTCQTLALLNKLGESEKDIFLLQHFTQKEIQQLSLSTADINGGSSTGGTKEVCTLTSLDASSGRKIIQTQDLSPNVVSISGVLLSTKEDKLSNGGKGVPSAHVIIPVQSTKTSLQNLALAIVSGSPVLLEGPVGSGKTSYVEHIANLTGRGNPCDLIKVQLGDQTDSKALVGTYRCTEIPGEFVWQPGCQEGKWILLEDLDYAPMDVISVLLPLLESGSLTVPGHGDTIRAAPGFQIFATQRLYSHDSGLYRQQSAHSAVLDHCWTKVRVNSLSKNELYQVIVKLYPKLETVAGKLLEIFLLLCASYHEQEEEEGAVAMETNTELLEQTNWKQRGNRLVSTRDLLKWCDRVSQDQDFTTSQTANMVLLEALDCFTSCLPKPEMRLAAAQAIGALINISREQTQYFCQSYKPAIEVHPTSVRVGRITLQKKVQEIASLESGSRSNFSFTRHSLVLLERIAACIFRTEPVLLVGETGTGKTSTVQYLAKLAGQRLKVINMNQQSDSTDLLGGYKPVDIRRLVAPVREKFEQIFVKTFSRKQNLKFLGHIQKSFHGHQWQNLLKLMNHSTGAAVKKQKAIKNPSQEQQEISKEWKRVSEKLNKLKLQIKHAEGALAFTFVEGTLVRALHDGDWILLDEINLASAETLECLSSLLEGPNSSLMLMEKGDLQPVVRHPDFRLFACMNPATDIGKKELPMGIRNRFTEFYVDELVSPTDLQILICDYLKGFNLSAGRVQSIVSFYTSVRSLSKTKLMDGTGHHPHFSLRTLCRALSYAATNPCGIIPRSLYESFCLSFLTQLDKASCPMVRQLILKYIVGKTSVKGILGQPIPPPLNGDFTKVEGYWIAQGQKEPCKPKGYILTQSVKGNLKMLARIVSARRFPVLLQGETSVGKTSLIQYLAQLTGNVCVRVNNHEHTDLQEYVGFYAADETGKLVFKEGVLVDAMRKGYWIILDELNLAPSDVLEALNRLLDDNRELFIPETQEMVSAHPGFMLFATQNPPGQYGGRKILSRAFRNRFVELHFDEIPSRELETILHGRCAIPESYSQKMVSVMLELGLRRKGSGVFAGKQGFMTLRDLFRWAERYHQSSLGGDTFHDWDQHIADEGFLLLAGKVRRLEEREVVKEVLQQKLKRTVNDGNLFSLHQETSLVTKPILEKVINTPTPKGFEHLVWTASLRRLAVLVGQALKFGEPVLLVGETGCGKTTVCQLFSELASKQLFSVNCHLHTETSDFLGGLRPVRSHEAEDDNKKLFEWCDGPLVLAMKQGNPFLIDEISLADDSVLERLNSVLEPEQKLLLAERGSGENQDDVEEVDAQDGFHITATMNPGGDYGKKELSPALRNRFTEIWCEQSTTKGDLVDIIEHNIKPGIQLANQEDCSSGIGTAMMEFLEWFRNNEVGQKCTVSVRDLLSWVNFINTCCAPDVIHSTTIKRMDPAEAYTHGACLVFLDGLGVGPHSRAEVLGHRARQICLEFLHKQIVDLTGQRVDLSTLTPFISEKVGQPVDWVQKTDTLFGINPFYITRGPPLHPLSPTTAMNALRLLRALQLPKAVLLEGSPGVGKTSLVTALAKSSGNNIVRINLSEQTDVTDLFGADLPVEGGEGGQFAWRDGPLLQALKAGHWVVLDELNLASQSVLEGLNACLDHRGEIFVPELGKYFQIQHKKTRIFACQNPLKQGGGRKGLPKSFLNRFTQVLDRDERTVVWKGTWDNSEHMYSLHGTLTTRGSSVYHQYHVSSNSQHNATENGRVFTKVVSRSTREEILWAERRSLGVQPQDLFRWCDLMVHDQGQGKGHWDPSQHVGLIYSERLRLPDDKKQVLSLFEKVLGGELSAYRCSREVLVTLSLVQVGHSFLPREMEDCESDSIGASRLFLLHHDLQPLESLMKCLQMNWMSILVGPTACGKSSLARLVASLTGHSLKVLAMNSAMDTTELLGGFEQTDLYRHYEKLRSKAERLTIHLQGVCLKTSFRNFAILQAVQSSWSQVASQKEDNGKPESTNPVTEFLDKMRKLEDHLVIVKENSLTLQQVQTDVDSLLQQLQKLSERVSEGDKHILGGGGQFEWVDGLLVQALQEGDWLLIDNVNFCSPSVLDRLNGLLEPNGVLTINERGIIDGQIPTIVPHPEFRLILAMDPKYGEISRAMRNRGVEICVTPDPRECEYSLIDMMTLLGGLGLSNEGSRQLIKIHSRMKSELRDITSISYLLLAASLTQQYLGTGRSWQRSLEDACGSVYVTSQLMRTKQKQAADILESILLGRDKTEGSEDVEMTEDEDISKQEEDKDEEEVADVVPIEDVIHVQLPSTSCIRADSALATVQRDVAIVEYLCQEINRDDDGKKVTTPMNGKIHFLGKELVGKVRWKSCLV
ncbi:hypothetical protein BSL78_20512 [Apostichopus japonicus]|uniref:Midasin n=1 Tax=Stichopus japonicus TaxID=307972 RepID=A0A2G8K3Q8_STIJA|nr:hypothetical protein BSL78_20512 [Apostichopus japonicus]